MRSSDWSSDVCSSDLDYIARVNAIRRDNPALHELDNLRFYPAHDDNVLFYGKLTADGGNMIFVAVNLDPFEAHEAEIERSEERRVGKECVSTCRSRWSPSH